MKQLRVAVEWKQQGKRPRGKSRKDRLTWYRRI